jgi:uncharacterized lipoprotein YajG
MKNLFILFSLFLVIGCTKNQHIIDCNIDDTYEVELNDLDFYSDTIEFNLTDPKFIE